MHHRLLRGGKTRGYDAGKNVSGRKRHIVVDTLGFVLAVHLSEASLHDSRGAEELLFDVGRRQEEDFPRLEEVVADSAYAGERVAAAAYVEGCWDITVVRWIARAHVCLAAPRAGPRTLRPDHARPRLLPHGQPPRQKARARVKTDVVGFTDGL